MEDSFGVTVELSGSGSTALIGAIKDENSEGEKTGSAYVFERNNGDWIQQAKLTADDGEPRGEGYLSDYFGISVSISENGDFCLIGARHDDNSNGDMAGAAYVFSRSGGDWTQQAKLIADDGSEGDSFGTGTTLSGDGTTALVTAPSDDNPKGERAGSTYVFEQNRGDWTQETKLTADDGDQEDTFGRSVEVTNDGTTALIGADGDEDPNGEEAGSAYIFERANISTSQSPLVEKSAC